MRPAALLRALLTRMSTRAVLSVRVASFAMGIVVALPGQAGAQPQQYARLRGVVTDASTQQPVRGVRVVIAATGRFVTTDSVGRFELRDIPTGVIRFFFTAEGFPRTSVVLAFARGETMVQAFELDSTAAGTAPDTGAANRRAQWLAATEIKAEPSRGVRYEDFERRMKTGRGQYVTRQEIEQRGYNSLADAARNVRGVAVDCVGFSSCRVRFARAAINCAPQFIVDGRPDNHFGPFVAVRDIEGLEFYAGASDVPGEFAGFDAACGVVVVWTRNGPPAAGRPAQDPPASTRPPAR